MPGRCPKPGSPLLLLRGVMGVHKLTAGDGYTYLTRQVAVHDATDRGHAGTGRLLRREGRVTGPLVRRRARCASDLEAGSQVTETQMRNLFGEGRHPDAERLENAALDAGRSVEQAKKASQLGRVFAVYPGNQPEFIQETAKRYIAYNLRARRALEDPGPGRGTGADPHRTGQRAFPPRARPGPAR